MIERVAEALYRHAVKQAYEQIAAEVLPIEKIVAVFEEAVTASDREAAIVIFCLIDDLATDFFRRKLIGKVSSGVDETFLTGNGMLASAYNKIALLAGLEWIQNETYRNLTLMRKIRNEFAHHVEIQALRGSANLQLYRLDGHQRKVRLGCHGRGQPASNASHTLQIPRSVISCCYGISARHGIHSGSHRPQGRPPQRFCWL
jgi:hypothetical protein